MNHARMLLEIAEAEWTLDYISARPSVDVKYNSAYNLTWSSEIDITEALEKIEQLQAYFFVKLYFWSAWDRGQ